MLVGRGLGTTVCFAGGGTPPLQQDNEVIRRGAVSAPVCFFRVVEDVGSCPLAFPCQGRWQPKADGRVVFQHKLTSLKFIKNLKYLDYSSTAIAVPLP